MPGFPVKRSYFNALQAEEMDALISELARVAGRERALMADCGDLLFKTCTSQVSLTTHFLAIFPLYYLLAISERFPERKIVMLTLVLFIDPKSPVKIIIVCRQDRWF